MIGQWILDLSEVTCHCMLHMDEFAFRIPKGTKLPTIAKVPLFNGRIIAINIRDEVYEYGFVKC